MVLEANNQQISTTELQETKLYKKRWLILLLYVIVIPCDAMQWNQYVTVADVIADYYNVSYEDVDWTSLITSLCFMIFSLPCCYIVDKYGNRGSAIVSGIGTSIGAWIKVASVSADRFWLVIFSQAVMAVTHAPMLNMAPKIAANWFGPDEVSIACAIGITGMQIGLAFGFVLPPLLIRKETVKIDLFKTNIGVAVICTIAALLIFFFFTDKPPVPPSYAVINQNHKIKYIESTKKVLKNKSFLLLLLGYGLTLAIYVVFQTVLNQLILKLYPDGSEDVGLIGLLMIVMSICGTIFAAFLIDKLKTFRLLLIFFGLFVTLTLIAFTFTLDLNIIYPYILCSLFGFSTASFWSVSLQITIETVYPEPEVIIFGYLNAFGQLLGIGYTYAYSYFLYEISDFWANCFLCISSLICLLITICTKFDLNRTNINTKQ
ncbi:hypothetical protein RN001_007595 [Aquatica leii]|uniref:Major facilitator superfamily (MFS) profile domain-containing protein n=1 Tax=Aquatica leii TaxID=1421715 RepID=A0AAN7SGW4_9COLE|nr:hypothetical protein RN001_007595 [Aquatica leii]